jgi:PST family polysaccharide transporter
VSLKKNVVGLALTQVFTYVLPLAQFPYLTRTLGTELFGLVMLSLSITTMLHIITDYGFDLYGTKKLSGSHSNNKKIGCYLSKVLTSKILLSLFAVGVGFIMINGTELVNHAVFNSFLILNVFINSFSVQWLYYALEKSYIYARITIIVRTLSLLMVFLFVNSRNDYVLYSVISAISSGLITLISYYIVLIKWDISIVRTKIGDSIVSLKDSFMFFISRASSSIYVNGCSIFLGYFSTLSAVATYSTAEKLYTAGVGVLIPLFNSITPYMNRTKNYDVLIKLTLVSVSICTVGSIVGFYFGGIILDILFGNEFGNSKDVLNIFMIGIIFYPIMMMFGYPAMMPISIERYANYSVFIGGVVQIFQFSTILITGIKISPELLATTFVISNLFVMVFRLSFFMKNKSLWKKNEY